MSAIDSSLGVQSPRIHNFRLRNVETKQQADVTFSFYSHGIITVTGNNNPETRSILCCLGNIFLAAMSLPYKEIRLEDNCFGIQCETATRGKNLYDSWEAFRHYIQNSHIQII